MELLAPAKNIDIARAAIMAGADAVYIGAPAFGARQAAGNSIADIAALVQFAQPYGVKVLVTVNTLMDDAERKQAAAMIHELYHAGVYAIIVQDLRLLREDLPPIRLHASTQCDNRTPEQVVALQQMGFRRAVLARELSIEQIRAIHEATLRANNEQPIELEVFVHGALCVSYSGKCYMSERLFGRSANRGACAQCCRMAYDVLDKDGRELTDADGRPLHQRYVLSLKDLDRSAYLDELRQAGVHTLKIEGRLKDADYVTNIVAYYRQRLDRIAENEKTGKCVNPGFVPNPDKTFHRGATEYFLHGRTPSMANWESPKSIGEQIGIVTSCRERTMHIQLLPGITLNNGDGLCYADRGFQVNSVQAMSGNSVSISTYKPIRIPVGTMLYRNTDTAFLKQLHAERRIPVTLALRTTEEGFNLEMRSIAPPLWTVSRTWSHPHTPADNANRARDTQRTQLGKLGDTPYTAVAIELPDEAWFVPIGTLNAWRRELVTAVSSQQPTPMPKPMPMPTAGYQITDEQLPSYDSSHEPLMTCKYCLLYEMGHCRKQPSRLKPEHEPRYLRLSNGTRLALRFDCQACQMTIHATT